MASIMIETLHQPVVKAAIEALQSGDLSTWVKQFEPGAVLYDDGRPRDLARFTQEALGHERFTGIDQVSPNGLEITGLYHSDTWGSFRTYFRFSLSAAGRIDRLDIGQAA